MASTEADLLREINARLPEGVDWKQGAVTYLKELVEEGGETQEWFHLVKPFLGGPDYDPVLGRRVPVPRRGPHGQAGSR